MNFCLKQKNITKLNLNFLASTFEYILSYFTERPVCSLQSKFNGLLEVSLHKGQWKLSTENAVYSFGKHYTSYKIAFDRIGIYEVPIKNMLLLGTGLGSVAQLLKKHPTLAEITTVDIDPAVTTLAQQYWQGNPDCKVNFVTADALDFLKNNTQHFDLIVADLFIDDLTPEHFLDETFLTLLQKTLQPKGWLLFSKLHYQETHQKANVGFSKTFQKVFPQGYTIRAVHNLVFVGTKAAS